MYTMRMWLSLAAMSAVFVVGCNKSPEGGSPGTANTFKIIGPTMTTHIKQNEKEAVKLNLDRKSDFKKDVKLSVDKPKGLTAELNKDVVKANEGSDFSVTIGVDKDAALGDHVVKVTGTPEGGGAPTTVDVKVNVEKNP
jgi:uncharacterized membrane protein